MKVSKQAMLGLAVVGCLWGESALAILPVFDSSMYMKAVQEATLQKERADVLNSHLDMNAKDVKAEIARTYQKQADDDNYRAYMAQTDANVKDANRSNEALKQLQKVGEVWNNHADPLSNLRTVFTLVGSPDVMASLGLRGLSDGAPMRDADGNILLDRDGKVIHQPGLLSVASNGLLAGFQVAKAINGSKWTHGANPIAAVTGAAAGTPTNAAVAAAMQVDVQAALARNAGAQVLYQKTGELATQLGNMQTTLKDGSLKSTRDMMDATAAIGVLQGQLQAIGNTVATNALLAQTEATVVHARSVVVSQQLAKNTNGKLLAGW